MKALRKFQKTIATTLLVIFSSYFFTGCNTLKTCFYKPVSSTKLSTERIPRTEKKTGIKNYDYEITQNPTIDNTEVNLKIQENEQYKVKTRERISKYKRTKFANIWKYIGLPVGFFAGIGMGAIFCVPEDYDHYSNGTYYFDKGGYVGSSELYSEPGAVSFITGGIVGFAMLYSWYYATFGKRLYKHNYKYYYKNPLPLPNSNISIIASNKSIMFKTDNNGYLNFSPLNDFKIDYSKYNTPYNFNLKTNNINFEKPLKLKPSLWMNRYAKITSKECNINLNQNLYSNKLGIARKGMEYKILTEQSNLLKIKLANKTGWINSDCAETYYSIPIKKDISNVIKNYVEEQMNSWQQQGEFESPENYQKRMITRDKKLKEITQQAMNMFQQDYANLIDWNKSTINRYDPNSQTFKINIPDLDTIIVSVPIEKARRFKENWTNKNFKNQKFVLVDGNWQLASLDIKNTAMNYTAKYSSKISNIYDPTNQFAFNLDPINVVIPTQNKTETTHEIFDTYSINTNLPQTNMSNPNAMAVVIGNSNYSFTEPVNFAINDAQLVKVYLINILGFKPGNIIFVPNATKGQFEGLFGSKGNPKGKLFNYVKSGVSDIFVFYSGHGAPGLKDQKGYFVPVDCDPMYVELQGYPIDLFYKNLAQIPANSTTVILDACFSGAGVIKQISGVIIKPKIDIMQNENSVIITSSTGKEVSSWYNAKHHGLFTYFFLKAIHDFKNSDKNSDRNLTFQEIYNYLSDNSEGVPYYARRLNGIEQHPTIQGTDKEKIFVKFK